MTLDSHIEAILFFKSEPVSVETLAKILGKSEEEIRTALRVLRERLSGTGLCLMQNNDSVMLGTAAEFGGLIEKLQKEELSKDLGRAGLETLTIVLYESPVAKSEIDYIRGVNSSFIIRNLLVRGLVERDLNPKDKRTFLYRPTFDLLSYLGISKVDDLPEYEDVRKEIEQFKNEFGAEGLSEVTEPTPEKNS